MRAIRTTESKAKELSIFADKLITMALQDTLHARRQAFSVLGQHHSVKSFLMRSVLASRKFLAGTPESSSLASPRRRQCPNGADRSSRACAIGSLKGPPRLRPLRSKHKDSLNKAASLPYFCGNALFFSIPGISIHGYSKDWRHFQKFLSTAVFQRPERLCTSANN